MSKLMNEFMKSFRDYAFDAFLDDDDDREYFKDINDLCKFAGNPGLTNEYFGEMPNEKSRAYIAALFLDEAEKVQDARMRKRLMDEYGDGSEYAEHLNEILGRGFYGGGSPDGEWLATDGTKVIKRVIRYISAEILNVPYKPCKNGGMNEFRLVDHGAWADPEYLFHGLSFNYWDIVEGIADEDGNEKELEDITDEDIANELWCSASCGCGYFPEK